MREGWGTSAIFQMLKREAATSGSIEFAKHYSENSRHQREDDVGKGGRKRGGVRSQESGGGGGGGGPQQHRRRCDCICLSCNCILSPEYTLHPKNMANLIWGGERGIGEKRSEGEKEGGGNLPSSLLPTIEARHFLTNSSCSVIFSFPAV